MESDSHYDVFAHLNAPRSRDYRRVLDGFAARRRDFIIHLRPPELCRELCMDEEELNILLEQLYEWGNLDRGRDHMDAATITEFYRVKWLYQLSERGEAAERALELFEASLGQAGELQSGALRDIMNYLEAMERLLQTTPLDHAKLYQEMNHLDNRFDEFTTQAQRFMRSLQGTIELHGLSQEDFLTYKEHVIDYLERFVHDLVASTNEVEQRMRRLEAQGLRETFPTLARHAMTDAMNPDDLEELAAAEERRSSRWEGLRQWFIGAAGGHSQAELLRARTREAIPALLLAMRSFHDRRESGSDRRRDWLQLARWFAEVPDDASAHRLWWVAFAMAPTRHLSVNEETLRTRDENGEPKRVSWLDAEPMWLAPSIRKYGSTPRPGRAPEIIDLSKDREYLRQLAEEENRQILAAHELLLREERTPLSAFATLDRFAFRLLLDLLGRAVVEAFDARPGESVERRVIQAQSSDGSLRIDLHPPSPPEAVATLMTTEGHLTGPDYRVAIWKNGNLRGGQKPTSIEAGVAS